MQNLRTETDDKLVHLYEAGNDAAFDVLLERHQKPLYGYILTVVCDTDLAEDIFQDTFYKAINCIREHRYVDNDKFQKWIIRIAHNLIIDRHRRQVPIVEVADETERVRLFESGNGMAVGSIEDQYHNSQTFADLSEMISRLPLPQQQTLQQRIYEGLSFREIAKLQNCSINTALGRMRYAVLNLRRMAAHHDLTTVVYD